MNVKKAMFEINYPENLINHIWMSRMWNLRSNASCPALEFEDADAQVKLPKSDVRTYRWIRKGMGSPHFFKTYLLNLVVLVIRMAHSLL